MDRTQYMSQEEVAKLWAYARSLANGDTRYGRQQGPLTWLVVHLALSTGLRVSELALLQVDDIDVERSFITVTRLKKRERTGKLNAAGKPEYRCKLVREPLAISPELLAHLQAYMEQQGLKQGALLVGQRGPLGKQGLQRIWKAAIQRAGLAYSLSIHCARHTLATHLLAKTGNLRLVQKQLGHSSMQVTADMYADVSFEDMKAGMTGLYEVKKGT